MKKIDLIYVNNVLLGYYDERVYKSYSNEEKKKLFNEIEKEIAKKDSCRKLSSLIIGLIMLVVAVTLAFLIAFDVINLGVSEWFNYTFIIAGLILAWLLLYYIFGFIFYNKLTINYHFKSKKSNNINSSLMYASSSYHKFVEQFKQYLRKTNFVIENKKNGLIPFCLSMPSTYKNLIFNGKINSNIPYFYLSIENKRLLFFPGMIMLIDGKNSKVLEIADFKVIEENNVYLLYNKDELIVSFKCNGEFNKNFFYFKYEQL